MTFWNTDIEIGLDVEHRRGIRRELRVQCDVIELRRDELALDLYI